MKIRMATYDGTLRECHSCGDDEEHCPLTRSACGHHCNHSWSHERCCWCGKEWGDELDRFPMLTRSGTAALGGGR